MVWDVVIDVLMPTGPSFKRRRENPDLLPVEVQAPGAFTRAMNESGWLDEEAIAVGVLQQGRPHSVLGLVTGLALVDLARPRPSKSLPREFALAVTADRVVAFAMSALVEGTDTTTTVVNIKRCERGSWPRELIRITDQYENRLLSGGTLDVAGERIPVLWDDHSSSHELLTLLAA